MDTAVNYMGAGRYLQAEFALNSIGDEASRLGKKAFIIGGEKALDATRDKIVQSLEKAGIEYTVHVFKGFPSMNQIEAYAARVCEYGADMVIGVGGGKASDTTKGVSILSKTKLIMIPTSVATCASYANVIIIYNDEGDVCSAMKLEKPTDAIIVDTDIIVRHCPVRMMAAGIGDSMAKKPEIEFSLHNDPDWDNTPFSAAAYALAKLTWDLYLKSGKKACEDAKKGVISQEVNDIICANIVLTGACSNLVGGAKQLAIAHNIYNGMCKNFKAQQKMFIHGEMVSMGLPLQMAMNHSLAEEIEGFVTLLNQMGVPTKPAQMQMDASDDSFKIVLDYIAQNISYLNPQMQDELFNDMKQMWR